MPRKALTSPDLRFEDERMNRLMQHIRALTQEVQRLQQAVSGGTANQVLAKRTDRDYETTWVDP